MSSKVHVGERACDDVDLIQGYTSSGSAMKSALHQIRVAEDVGTCLPLIGELELGKEVVEGGEEEMCHLACMFERRVFSLDEALGEEAREELELLYALASGGDEGVGDSLEEVKVVLGEALEDALEEQLETLGSASGKALAEKEREGGAEEGRGKEEEDPLEKLDEQIRRSVREIHEHDVSRVARGEERLRQLSVLGVPHLQETPHLQLFSATLLHHLAEVLHRVGHTPSFLLADELERHFIEHERNLGRHFVRQAQHHSLQELQEEQEGRVVEGSLEE